MDLDQALDVLGNTVRPAPPAPTTDRPTVLRRVVVVDVAGGISDRTTSRPAVVDIEIVDGVIAAIETSSGEPEGFVTPGLVDMHTHLPSDNPTALADLFGLLYLVHGVTTIRDTGDMDGTGVQAARRAFAATGAGPRVVSAGAFVGGRGQHRWPNTKVLERPTDADRVVAELIAEGSQLVKAYEHLDVASIRALVVTARAHGLPVIGHVPHALAYEEALIPEPQHFFGVPAPDDLTCSSVVCRGGDWQGVDEQRLRDVVDVTIEHRMGNTPTLAQTDALLRYRRPDLIADDPVVSLLPPFFANVVWHHEHGIPVYRELPPERLDALDDALAKKQRLTKLLVEAGCRVHLGTDVQQPFVVPGAALHREMQLFVDAGISPADVWRLVTVDAHRHLDAPHGGAIAVGARADLLLHRSDPTVTVNVADTVTATMVDGRMFLTEHLWSAVRRHQQHHRRSDIDQASATLAEFAMSMTNFRE